MKRIASIGNVIQRENPETEIVEPVPVFTLELINRIKINNSDADIDLQFGMAPDDYERIFRKELSFSNMEEMGSARKLLDKIEEYDDDDITYVILNSPFNNTLLILTKDLEGETFQFDNIKQYEYMVSILKWITDQERYF
jgi:hypothetical protein